MHKDLNSEYARLLIKDDLLYRQKQTDFVGIRIWRADNYSLGHVALKTYGENGQYISFYPSCKKFNSDSKGCQMDCDHLHTEQEDQGVPEEFLIKVNDVQKINQGIYKISEAIKKGEIRWYLWSNFLFSRRSLHCSHLTLFLLSLGGINLTFLMRNKLAVKFLIYYFIRKYGLPFLAGSLCLILMSNRTYHNLFLFLSKCKEKLFLSGSYYTFDHALQQSNFIIRFFFSMVSIIENSSYRTRVRNYQQGLLVGFLWSTALLAGLLFPGLYLISILVKSAYLTPEDLFVVGQKLDLIKDLLRENPFKYQFNKLKPGLLRPDKWITNDVALVSVVNTLPLRLLGNPFRWIGHAAILVECFKEMYTNLLTQRLTDLDKMKKAILDKDKSIRDQKAALESEIKQRENSNLLFLVKSFFSRFRQPNRERKLTDMHSENKILYDQLKQIPANLEALETKRAKIHDHLLDQINKSTDASYYAGIFDIHAPKNDDAPSGQNSQWYIEEIKVKEYIGNPDTRKFTLLSGVDKDSKMLNRLIDRTLRTDERVYSLGRHALQQLLSNIEFEIDEIAAFKAKDQKDQLTKFQLCGQLTFFPFKAEGINCTQWCHQHLHRVGAISADQSNSQSKPPTGIKQIAAAALGFN
ncbi:MAG: hypothetical protein JSR33_05520 [Proteobacteria bacterium]|nr:hypothetical protein [Pseudomonadota bacterium]